MDIAWNIDHPSLIVGVVTADGVTIGPTSDAGLAALRQSVDHVHDLSDGVRTAVRKLLKYGGFKATGRNKPASEYLDETRKRGEWPFIFNAVDVNNLMSLETGWPMSVLDRDKCTHDEAGAQTALEIRFGRPDEKYVFNAAGHQIDLAGLFGLARVGGAMLGNPVKDGMHAKIDVTTTRLIACLWTTRELVTPSGVRAVADDFEQLLRHHCGATSTTSAVLGGA